MFSSVFHSHKMRLLDLSGPLTYESVNKQYFVLVPSRLIKRFSNFVPV